MLMFAVLAFLPVTHLFLKMSRIRTGNSCHQCPMVIVDKPTAITVGIKVALGENHVLRNAKEVHTLIIEAALQRSKRVTRGAKLNGYESAPS